MCACRYIFIFLMLFFSLVFCRNSYCVGAVDEQRALKEQGSILSKEQRSREEEERQKMLREAEKPAAALEAPELPEIKLVEEVVPEFYIKEIIFDGAKSLSKRQIKNLKKSYLDKKININ
ncbi:hypothetical protein KKC59_04475, partial [bacterium]|nr:hypothetical protein [bacterium]